MANCVTGEQVTTDKTAHALCVLDKLGYRPTLRISNTYCFSTATMDMPTPSNVKSYLHCLSCFSETAMLFGQHYCAEERREFCSSTVRDHIDDLRIQMNEDIEVDKILL